MKSIVIINVVIIAAVIFYLIPAAFKMGQNSIEKQAAQTNASFNSSNSEPVQVKSWKKVIEFSGSGAKNTEPFSVTTNSWRVVWNIEPYDGQEKTKRYMSLNCHIMVADNPKEPSFGHFNSGSSVNDISYYVGKGNYYLAINSANSKYKLTVEQSEN